jgi:hypothetical protein
MIEFDSPTLTRQPSYLCRRPLRSSIGHRYNTRKLSMYRDLTKAIVLPIFLLFPVFSFPLGPSTHSPRARWLAVLLLLVLGSVLAASCDRCQCPSKKTYTCPQVQYPPELRDITVRQGIGGHVWFWRGGFMPICPTGTVRAVARKLYVYELTSYDRADPSLTREGFYRAVHSALLDSTYSDTTGFYQLPLPVGRYSVFVLEDSLLYPPWFGDDWLSPVSVGDGSVTPADIDIDYLASY